MEVPWHSPAHGIWISAADSDRLTGTLDLDQLTDGLLTSLTAAASILQPAPLGSADEAKQLAALSALVSIACGQNAGFLGGGWVTVLRALSALDLLKVRESEPEEPGRSDQKSAHGMSWKVNSVNASLKET